MVAIGVWGQIEESQFPPLSWLLVQTDGMVSFCSSEGVLCAQGSFFFSDCYHGGAMSRVSLFL